jgi:hypothetical protein
MNFQSSIYSFILHQLQNVRCASPLRCSFRSADIFDLFREVLLGITGKDFTLIATSKAAMRGATILKASDDKTRQLNKHTLMAFSGEAGDTSMWLLHSHCLKYTADISKYNSPNIFKQMHNSIPCATMSTYHRQR